MPDALILPLRTAQLDVERAAVWLRKAKDVDQIREVRDQARAIEAYQRQRSASLSAQNDAAEIALRAERRLGELCKEVIRHKGGNPQLSPGTTVRLSDLGISRDHSSRWQKLAAMPEDAFDQHIVATAAKCERLTTSGTIAAVSNAADYDGDEWYTPSGAVEAAREVMGGIDFDPASNPVAQKTVKATRYFTKEDDGLGQEWKGRGFINPPFTGSLAGAFARKLIAEIDAGRVTQAILLQNCTCMDTRWLHELVSRSCVLCFTKGRLKFYQADGKRGEANRYGQVFIYHGPNVDRFTDVFSKLGLVLTPDRLED